MPDIKLLTDKDARIVNGKFQYNDGEKWVETQDAYKTYGVRIPLAVSACAGISYIGDAEGMTPGSLEWDNTPIFQNIKPCVVSKNVAGNLNFMPFKKYLNPQDFTKFADGTDATPYIQGTKDDYRKGVCYDVLIEIPKLGVKIARGYDFMTVQITNDPDAEGFSYKAHSDAAEGDCNYIYVGAFLASGDDMVRTLHSHANVSPLVNTDLDTFRDMASTSTCSNGVFELLNFYTLTLLQCLFLIRYCNRDSQTALGMGYVGDTNYEFGAKNTGATLDKGMYYGSSDSMVQMKFMGIEDFWGNIYQWVDGLMSSGDFHIYTCYKSFNLIAGCNVDTYDDQGQIMISYVSGYMKEPQGTNDLGFIPKVCGGSATTYFADYASCFYAEYAPVFGGDFDDGSVAGAFQLGVRCGQDRKVDNLGGRLMLVASTDIEEVDSFETE